MEKQGGFRAPRDCSGGPDVQWADQGVWGEAGRGVLWKNGPRFHGCEVLRRASGIE